MVLRSSVIRFLPGVPGAQGETANNAHSLIFPTVECISVILSRKDSLGGVFQGCHASRKALHLHPDHFDVTFAEFLTRNVVWPGIL